MHLTRALNASHSYCRPKVSVLRKNNSPNIFKFWIKWIIELKNLPEHLDLSVHSTRVKKNNIIEKTRRHLFGRKGEFSNPNNLSKNISIFWDGLFVSFRSVTMFIFISQWDNRFISLFGIVCIPIGRMSSK